MHLYALTLQKASCIYQAVHGNFSGTKQQEILVGRGKTLELLRADPNTGKLHSVVSKEVCGLIRSIQPVRLTGSTKGVKCNGVVVLINATHHSLVFLYRLHSGGSGLGTDYHPGIQPSQECV